MSKPVFAYAVMKLVEKGVLDLDAPLTKYTRGRIVDDPRIELVTVRRVLSHTTGFQNWSSREDALRIHFQPGERFQYSGEGYSYLQNVVTQLVGGPYRRVHENASAPTVPDDVERLRVEQHVRGTDGASARRRGPADAE